MRITQYSNGVTITKEMPVDGLPDDLLATLRYNALREAAGVSGSSEPCLDVELDDDQEQAMLLDRLMDGMDATQQYKFAESTAGAELGVKVKQ